MGQLQNTQVPVISTGGFGERKEGKTERKEDE